MIFYLNKLVNFDDSHDIRDTLGFPISVGFPMSAMPTSNQYNVKIPLSILMKEINGWKNYMQLLGHDIEELMIRSFEIDSSKNILKIVLWNTVFKSEDSYTTSFNVLQNDHGGYSIKSTFPFDIVSINEYKNLEVTFEQFHIFGIK